MEAKSARKTHLTAIMTCLTTGFVATGVMGQSNVEWKAELYHTPSERRDIADLRLNGISIGALLELEASVGEDAGEDASDIVLATFELGIEADVAEGISAAATLLWEEEDTEPVDLDTGVVILGGTEAFPLTLQVGKLYVPFGVFNSHFVSDPLVLEMAETRESAVLLAYGNERFNLSAGAFNGAVDENPDDDHVDNLVVACTLTPTEGVEAGAYWVSDLGDSDGLEGTILDAVSGTNGLTYSEVGGLGGYLSLTFGDVMIEGEYIAALDPFDPGFLGEGSLKPKAWNLELAFAVSERLEFAAKYEGTDEFPGTPEAQYGLAASYGLTDSVTISAEYLHGEYEDSSEQRDVVTAQMGVEF